MVLNFPFSRFMRPGCKSLLKIVVFSLANSALYGQNFTKITTGALVTDGGASRSVNWIDYDNDGRLDLYVTNGLRQGQNNFMYRNDGPPNFTFTKITSGPQVNDRGKSDGSSWGDYDNDGDPDCFVVNWYGDDNMFFENNGNGTFTRIIAGAFVNDGGFSETCSWGDYDNDGYLDLYVSNSGDVNQTGPQRNFLYLNNKNKTFTKITSGAIVNGLFYSRGVNWVDYDDDGDSDMFVANEENQANNLYRNMLKETGSAAFSSITTGAVVTDAAASWSGSWGDCDNDGDLDLFVANWNNQTNALYLNHGAGNFTKVTNDLIVSERGYFACSGWGDFDNDGDLDMFVTTAYGPAASRNVLYRNKLIESGALAFEKIIAGSLVNDTGYSYGFSWGDYDRDGDLDIFIAKTLNEAENNAFYRNDGVAGNHWVEMNLIGVTSNRSGIGAKIKVKAAINGKGVWQRRDLEGQNGYCNQNLQAHFGLGNAGVIDSLRILWPSGKIDVLTKLKTDTLITITEGRTTAVHDGAGNNELRDFDLAQNFPNPLFVSGTFGTPSTIIRYTLPSSQHVRLLVYDTLGREVALLVNERKSAGKHTAVFQLPPQMSAGVYLYTIKAGRYRGTKKLAIMK